MLEISGPSVALWEPPTWATMSELLDYGSLEHRSCVGQVAPIEPEAPFAVDVVQRDELEPAAQPFSITRTRPHVSVAGTCFDADRARELGRLLIAAADLIDPHEPAAE